MHVNGEFQQLKPAVFERPGLESLVYAETRRKNAISDVLSGNVGPSPLIVGEENYLRSGSELSHGEWKKIQLARAAARLENARQAFGLTDIGYMRVAHGNELINLDKRMANVSIDTPFSERSVADASISTKDGFGSLYAPADCGVVTYAFEGAEAIGQAHVGIRGAVNAIIPRTLARATAMGHDTSRAVAYIAPHAHRYQMNRSEADDVYEIVADQDDETKREFLQNIQLGINGHPIMDISGIMHQQLVRGGINPDNIQISEDTTLGNRTLYSHQDALTTGVVNGRFGVLVGKTKR